MPADVVESNRSLLNPQDMQVLLGRMSNSVDEQTTVAEVLAQLGLDVNAPAATEFQRWTEATLGNAPPMGKMRNIAEGRHVQPGAGAVAERALAGSGSGAASRESAVPLPVGGVAALLNGEV